MFNFFFFSSDWGLCFVFLSKLKICSVNEKRKSDNVNYHTYSKFFFQTTKYHFKDKYFKFYYLKNIRYLYMYKSLLWIGIFLKSKKKNYWYWSKLQNARKSFRDSIDQVFKIFLATCVNFHKLNPFSSMYIKNIMNIG